MTSDYYRAPGLLKSELPLRSINQKVEYYERRLFGWFIGVAKALKDDPSNNPAAGPGADPATLAIVMSIFEPHGVLLQGNLAPRNKRRPNEPDSNANFTFAFEEFLAAKHPEWSTTKRKEVAQKVYTHVRCGLFHLNTAKKGVWYYRGPDERHPTPSIQTRYYSKKLVKVIFNVPAFVLEVDDYFAKYVSKLRVRKSSEREKFVEGWKIIKASLT